MILDEILAHKATELAARKAHEPESSVAARAATAPPPLDFRAALHGPDLSVIAEVKRSSPARGALRLDMDAARMAADYAAAGAAAISVLTDERYFRGSDADLAAVRQRVQVPLLRKDFVIEPYQVYEARALGADAVLLIVRALERRQIDELGRVAAGLGMAALVEVHTADELALAADIGATLIGINNRDLTTMTVDLETTARLLPLAPPGATMVSESGIKSPDDVLGLRQLGVDAVLVGEALVTAPQPSRLLAELVDAGRSLDDRPYRQSRRGQGSRTQRHTLLSS